MSEKPQTMKIDFNAIYIEGLDMIRKQGLSFLLLAAAVFFFYKDNSDLRKRIDDCNNNTITYFNEERSLFYEVIGENTATLKEIQQNLKIINQSK